MRQSGRTSQGRKKSAARKRTNIFAIQFALGRNVCYHSTRMKPVVTALLTAVCFLVGTARGQDLAVVSSADFRSGPIAPDIRCPRLECPINRSRSVGAVLQ